MTKFKCIQFNTLLLLFVFILFSFRLTGQNNEEEAIKLFNAKHYTEALSTFKNLNSQFPNNTSISYYLGVCLVETNQFGQEAKKLLLMSVKAAVPDNVNFYLGKNFHALNQFEFANAYYQMFRNIAKSKEIKSTGLKKLMIMSEKRINPFEKINEVGDIILQEHKALSSNHENDSKETPNIKKTERDINDSINENVILDLDTSVTITQITILEPDSIIIPFGLYDSVINFILTTEIYYCKVLQFRTYDGRLYFIEGWKSSLELKDLIIKTNLLRKDYENADSYEKKNEIANEVIILEQRLSELKNASDIQYMKSRDAENIYWNKQSLKEILKLKCENDSIEKSIKIIENLNAIIQDSVSEYIEDTVSVDTITAPAIILNHDNFSAESNNVVYKIQIGAFKTELPPASKALFKKLSVLRKIDNYTDEKGITYYTIGEVSNFKDAVKLQDQIRKESIKDAFIIIFKDGKKLPFNEAKEFFK